MSGNYFVSWGQPTHVRLLPAVRLPPSAPGAPRPLGYGECPAGCGRPSGSDACVSCSHGSYGTGSGICNLCGVGTYGNRTTMPAGLAAESAACISCANGQYNPAHGATACRLCPRGSFCADGYRLTEEGTLEPASPAGGIPLPIVCPRGRYNPDRGGPGPSACRLCNAGRYRATPNATDESECLACSPGRYSAANGSHTCTLCPASTASSVVAAAACDVCPPGRFSQSDGSLSCTDCPLGSAWPYEGGTSPTCEVCGVGRYSDHEGFSSCTACPNGTVGVALGANTSKTCEACHVGTYTPPNLTASSACLPCPNRSDMVISFYRGREFLRESPAYTCIYASSAASRRARGAPVGWWVAALVTCMIAALMAAGSEVAAPTR